MTSESDGVQKECRLSGRDEVVVQRQYTVLFIGNDSGEAVNSGYCATWGALIWIFWSLVFRSSFPLSVLPTSGNTQERLHGVRLISIRMRSI